MLSSKRKRAAAVLLTLTVGACGLPRCQALAEKPMATKTEDEKDKLLGTWTCLSATVSGKAVPEDTVKKLSLIFTKDKYTTKMGDQVLFQGGYKIDAGKNPKTIDIIALEGEQKGKTSLGIYAIDGETLKLCYSAEKDRPKEFESKADSDVTFATWKRKSND
jgi:uncharacterized protein (TIGR03067 family)